MTRYNQALRLLADADAVGEAFFPLAAQALTIALDCRWAGFARPREDGDAEIFAMNEEAARGLPLRYPLAGTACADVCASKPDDPYHFRGRERGVPRPRSAGRDTGSRHSYRGEAIFAADGTHLCHVFAVGDPATADGPEDRALFRLVARRAAAELSRPVATSPIAGRPSGNRTGYLIHCADAMRIPLNAMMGYAEAIPSTDAAVAVHHAAQIMAIGHSMRDVLDSIQLLARAEQGELALVEEPVDLNRIATAAAEQLTAAAQEQGVSLHVSIHSPSLPVLADPTLLDRLARCLLANAVRFTPANGQAAIAAGIGPHGGPELRVVDTGVGMASGQIESLLVPFRRPRKLDGGHGLGLPLASAICALHDGRLVIESAPRSGTTASVQLPAARQLRDIGPLFRAVA